jgi:predicted DNA-binding transcriptional regulator YafY
MPRDSTGFEKQAKVARMVHVLQYIAGSPHGITAAEIGRRTNRDKRTALRDINELEKAGIPIYQERDNTYRVPESYVLKSIAFTQPETMAILLATRLAVQHLDYSNEFLAMALNKLAATLAKGPVKVFVGESASQLAEKPQAPERQKVFGVVTQGLLEHKMLRFTYVDSKGDRSTRKVHPYFLEPISLMGGRGTYLVAKDTTRGAIRVFKLDRMVEAEVLPGDAYVPRDVELKKLVAQSWGIWTDGKVEHLELLFAPSAAGRAAETRWHPSQQTTVLKDGGLKMTLDVRGFVEITPWILSWGADVEVVGPPALRKRIAQSASLMAQNYS